MTDDEILICAPLNPNRIHGSVIRVCADCSQGVWLAPSGQRLVTAATVIVCTDCGLRRIAGDTEAEIRPLGMEQLNELREHRRRVSRLLRPRPEGEVTQTVMPDRDDA